MICNVCKKEILVASVDFDITKPGPNDICFDCFEEEKEAGNNIKWAINLTISCFEEEKSDVLKRIESELIPQSNDEK